MVWPFCQTRSSVRGAAIASPNSWNTFGGSTAAERTPGGTGSEESRTGETAEGAAIRGASPREGAHVWHLRLSVGEGP